MTIRDDVLELRIRYSTVLGIMEDATHDQREKRVEIAGFIGELDAILMKNPKEKDENGKN